MIGEWRRGQGIGERLARVLEMGVRWTSNARLRGEDGYIIQQRRGWLRGRANSERVWTTRARGTEGSDAVGGMRNVGA